MNTFRVVLVETSEVAGEFPNLAWADVFAEGMWNSCCEHTRTERWTGREWVEV